MTTTNNFGRFREPPYVNLRGEGGKGWSLRNDHILTLFGLPSNSPIPPGYASSKYIGDTLVQIRSREEMKRSPVKRRTLACCNGCGLLVCAGHLDQHQKGCKQWNDNTSK